MGTQQSKSQSKVKRGDTVLRGAGRLILVPTELLVSGDAVTRGILSARAKKVRPDIHADALARLSSDAALVAPSNETDLLEYPVVERRGPKWRVARNIDLLLSAHRLTCSQVCAIESNKGDLPEVLRQLSLLVSQKAPDPDDEELLLRQAMDEFYDLA